MCQFHGDMVILLEQLPYPGQPFGGVVKHGELARRGGILLETSHFHILLQHQTAVIERQFAGDDLHQGGLARPVAPHQTEALAPLDGELGLIEQRKITERQRRAVQCQKSHSCSLLLMKKRVADWISPRFIVKSPAHPCLASHACSSVRVKGQPSSRPASSRNTGMRTR